MLVAAEMNHAGLPWRADVHRALLHDLLGERYAGGGEPRRLAELAEEISAAFGRRVLRAAGRRVAAGDVDALPALASLATEVDAAIAGLLRCPRCRSSSRC